MWVWAGDGDADVDLLPHFPQYEIDGYGVGIAYKHVAGSYQLLIDNLLDLSHAPFVHKGLLGDRNTVANWDFSYDQGPRHIVDRRFFAARPAVPAWAKAYGDAFAPFEDRKRVVEGQSVSLRLALGGRRIIKKKNKERVNN